MRRRLVSLSRRDSELTSGEFIRRIFDLQFGNRRHATPQCPHHMRWRLGQTKAVGQMPAESSFALVVRHAASAFPIERSKRLSSAIEPLPDGNQIRARQSMRCGAPAVRQCGRKRWERVAKIVPDILGERHVLHSRFDLEHGIQISRGELFIARTARRMMRGRRRDPPDDRTSASVQTVGSRASPCSRKVTSRSIPGRSEPMPRRRIHVRRCRSSASPAG